MLYAANSLIVASCFEMASNDFWLCLELGLANYSPAYGLKLAALKLRMFFTFLEGYNKRRNNRKERRICDRRSHVAHKARFAIWSFTQKSAEPSSRRTRSYSVSFNFLRINPYLITSSPRGNPERTMR